MPDHLLLSVSFFAILVMGSGPDRCVPKVEEICFSTNKLVGKSNLSTSGVIAGRNEIVLRWAYFARFGKGNPHSDSFLDK